MQFLIPRNGLACILKYLSAELPATFPARRNPTPCGDLQSVKPCDRNLKAALLLAERMIKLADKGDADREDTGCGILYGMLRDTGYKIKQLAENEKQKHIAKGWWDKAL